MKPIEDESTKHSSTIAEVTTEKIQSTKKPEVNLDTPADRIPVFVQIPKKENNRRNLHTPSVSIIPNDNEEYNNKQKPAVTETLQVKKCPSGHARDKRGRCRKFRRPQFP